MAEIHTILGSQCLQPPSTNLACKRPLLVIKCTSPIAEKSYDEAVYSASARTQLAVASGKPEVT